MTEAIKLQEAFKEKVKKNNTLFFNHPPTQLIESKNNITIPIDSASTTDSKAGYITITFTQEQEQDQTIVIVTTNILGFPKSTKIDSSEIKLLAESLTSLAASKPVEYYLCLSRAINVLHNIKHPTPEHEPA